MRDLYPHRTRTRRTSTSGTNTPNNQKEQAMHNHTDTEMTKLRATSAPRPPHRRHGVPRSDGRYRRFGCCRRRHGPAGLSGKRQRGGSLGLVHGGPEPEHRTGHRELVVLDSIHTEHGSDRERRHRWGLCHGHGLLFQEVQEQRGGPTGLDIAPHLVGLVSVWLRRRPVSVAVGVAGTSSWRRLRRLRRTCALLRQRRTASRIRARSRFGIHCARQWQGDPRSCFRDNRVRVLFGVERAAAVTHESSPLLEAEDDHDPCLGHLFDDVQRDERHDRVHRGRWQLCDGYRSDRQHGRHQCVDGAYHLRHDEELRCRRIRWGWVPRCVSERRAHGTGWPVDGFS